MHHTPSHVLQDITLRLFGSLCLSKSFGFLAVTSRPFLLLFFGSSMSLSSCISSTMGLAAFINVFACRLDKEIAGLVGSLGFTRHSVDTDSAWALTMTARLRHTGLTNTAHLHGMVGIEVCGELEVASSSVAERDCPFLPLHSAFLPRKASHKRRLWVPQ